MSKAICESCGGITNSTTSNAIFVEQDLNKETLKATECYVRWVKEGGEFLPEKGCAYDEADKYDKDFADKILRGEL